MESRTPLLVGLAVTGLVLVAGAAFALRPDPPPPPVEAASADSGMNDAAAEELMRAIGYVQQ